MLLDDDVVALGFGLPSTIDQRAGRAISSVHIPLADLDFRDRMADRFGLPIAIDNDGNAAAIAEWRLGAGRGASHIVALTLGTGIGGGLILDGGPTEARSAPPRSWATSSSTTAASRAAGPAPATATSRRSPRIGGGRDRDAAVRPRCRRAPAGRGGARRKRAGRERHRRDRPAPRRRDRLLRQHLQPGARHPRRRLLEGGGPVAGAAA